MKGVSVLSKERLDNSVLNNAISTYKTVGEVAGDIIDEDYSPVLDKVTLAFLEELKQYRDLEEQGLLLRLPCKVGDTLYKPEWGHILAYKVSGVSFNVSKFKLFQNGVLEKVYPDYSNKSFYKCLDERCDFDDIGKNIFLTQSEAEEKLRELEGK